MELIEINNEHEYEEFVKNNYKSHFMQSWYWGEVMKYKNFIPHYLFLKDNDKVLGSILLLEKKLLLGYSYYYAPRGFLADYSDKNIIKIFTEKLKKFARKNKGIFIKIDPDIKLHNLNLDGNVIEGNNNEYLVDYLKSLGYKHKGFYKSFKGEQPRYTFRLSLDDEWDNIYKNIHPTTRKILNKGNQFDLDIYIGNNNDIGLFYETMVETAERENLRPLPIKYYENFYNILNKNNMSDLYVVKVRVDKLIETYSKRVNDIKEEIKNLDNFKNENKKKNLLNDLTNKLEKANKELDNIKKIDKDEIILSSIITVKYNDKVWTIHGGNSTLLRELNSNYLLYYKIIKDAYNDGYKIIDFFGTSGIANPDKNDPIYGIHNFKKRLGGEYTEFIGEFDLIINKFMYFIFDTLIPIYHNVKNKFKK